MNDNIFVPKFTITPDIASALESIERHSWLVDNMLIMPRHEAQLRWLWRDVRIRRVTGTTRIEGARLDEAAVSRLVRRNLTGNYTEDERANINALAAYEFIDFLGDQLDIPMDELVIRELNRQFMRGSVETLTRGAYRKGLNRVGNFSPPDQGDVPSLMRSFALWIRETGETHPVLQAGIVHIHIVAVHPFWDGNGRTARGVSTLMLQRSSFGFRRLLSLEAYLFRIRDNYIAAIERTLGTWFSPEYDATQWLEFFTLSLKLHVEELVERLTDWHRMMQRVHSIAEKEGWLQRHIDGYAFAAQAGQITRAEYMEITGVSQATASRDLSELVSAGILVAEGKTRTRFYRPNPELFETSPEIPAEQLPPIPEQE